MAKAANGHTDRGITLFENQNSKGIIYHGSDTRPSGEIELAVWDKLSPLTQIIIIRIPDPHIREQTASSIAASYRFTINKLPNHDTLVNLANESAASFTPNTGERIKF